MEHKIVRNIRVRTAAYNARQPLETVVPDYQEAYKKAVWDAEAEIKWLGLSDRVPLQMIESEVVHLDDPYATIRFTFLREYLGVGKEP